MSTISATAAGESSPGLIAKNHFLLRRLHSLTGIIFGMYLFVHLGVNATLAEGSRHAGHPTVFQGLVDYIHSIPFLPVVEFAMIFGPLLYHTIYGFYIFYTGQFNIGRYGYTRNWLYVLQRISALVIVVFALFHILSLKAWLPGEFAKALVFVPGEATTSTANHLLAAPWIWAVAYPIGVLASAFHTANGFYAAAITWGLAVSATAQRRWGMLCSLAFLFLFAAGMTALIAGVTVARQPVNQAGMPTTSHAIGH